MIVASGQAKGFAPTPALAAEAIARAMTRAGIANAECVLLMLTLDFASILPETLRQAAATAACLRIGGATASGLITEEGWQIDQPGAAALVFSDLPTATAEAGEPLLSLSGQGRLGLDWQAAPQRIGMIESHGDAWQNARVCADARCTVALPAMLRSAIVSPGLKRVGDTMIVSAARGHELHQLNGENAVASLRRAFPNETFDTALLHRLYLQGKDAAPATGILAANADGSLTMAAPFAGGEIVRWAIREAEDARREIARQLDDAASSGSRPDFALMFSCLGRGPLFHGSDDQDLLAFTGTFPGIPLLGAYGTGQIFPLSGTNRLFSNTVLTLLYENPHVQPQP